ncbi:MAG: hypothetical protein J2P54_03395 [Bradyrhizobiaceae bacterium]|nr:hypothetical protein [Bradyrhizobiaceae bacterium]
MNVITGSNNGAARPADEYHDAFADYREAAEEYARAGSAFSVGLRPT